MICLNCGSESISGYDFCRACEERELEKMHEKERERKWLEDMIEKEEELEKDKILKHIFCPVCSKKISLDEYGYIPLHYPPGYIPYPQTPGERNYQHCTGSGAKLSDWQGANRCGYCAYCGNKGPLIDCPECKVKVCEECFRKSCNEH